MRIGSPAVDSKAEPILIWGAGAIGGILGAWWTRVGQPVLLVDVAVDHVKQCISEGLTIEGPVAEFTQKIPSVTPAQVTGQYSRIILAVKAQDTANAMQALLPHLADDGFVLSAQNGLNERLISELAGAERTMGAFVNFAGDWLAPGRILFGNRGATVIGEIDGSIRQRTRDMHALMQLFEPDAVLTDDIWSYLWGKLGYGAMLFATALTTDSMTDNFSSTDRIPAMIGLAREVMAVAKAEQISPRGFNGFEPSAFWPGASYAKALGSINALAEFTASTAKTHTGIYRDLAIRKRRTEVDPQLGVIANIASEHGIATPLLQRLVELIHDIEAGRRAQSAATYAELSAIANRIVVT